MPPPFATLTCRANLPLRERSPKSRRSVSGFTPTTFSPSTPFTTMSYLLAFIICTSTNSAMTPRTTRIAILIFFILIPHFPAPFAYAKGAGSIRNQSIYPCHFHPKIASEYLALIFRVCHKFVWVSVWIVAFHKERPILRSLPLKAWHCQVNRPVIANMSSLFVNGACGDRGWIMECRNSNIVSVKIRRGFRQIRAQQRQHHVSRILADEFAILILRYLAEFRGIGYAVCAFWLLLDLIVYL